VAQVVGCPPSRPKDLFSTPITTKKKKFKKRHKEVENKRMEKDMQKKLK
jgi:hypothetical protein